MKTGKKSAVHTSLQRHEALLAEGSNGAPGRVASVSAFKAIHNQV